MTCREDAPGDAAEEELLVIGSGLLAADLAVLILELRRRQVAELRTERVVNGRAGIVAGKKIGSPCQTKDIALLGDAGKRMDSERAIQNGAGSLGLPSHPIQQALEPTSIMQDDCPSNSRRWQVRVFWPNGVILSFGLVLNTGQVSAEEEHNEQRRGST